MLEKITTSLENSKRLKELGFDKESIFYWSIRIKEENKPRKIIDLKEFKAYGKLVYQIEGKAYTADELLEYMPNIVKINGENYILKITKNKVYYGQVNVGNYYQEIKTNLSNALAELLIYLLENKLYAQLQINNNK